MPLTLSPTRTAQEPVPFIEHFAPLATWALTTHFYSVDASPQFTPEETEARRHGGACLGSEGTAVGGRTPHPSTRDFPHPCMLQNVGCDFEIDSGATEDRCGVCHGNGSTCHTVSGTFQEAEGLGMGMPLAGGRVALPPLPQAPALGPRWLQFRPSAGC